MRATIATGIAIQVWGLLVAAPARAAGPVEDLARALEEMRETALPTAPVELDGEVLFWVVGAKSFPADDRARAIRANIVALARDPAVRPESVQSVDGKFATRIVSGERPIMHLLKEPEPFVRQKSLGDFAVTYELNAYCDNAQVMNALYSDMHRNILDVFNEYGVQIMTPAYEGDPAEPKVVPKERWHALPAEGRAEPSATSGQSIGKDRAKADDRR